MKPLHFAFLMLINVAWGFNIVPVKLALNDMEPFLAAALRFIFLFIMCAPFLRWVPGRMKLLGAAALMTGAVQFSLMNLAFVSARNMSALAIVGQLWVPFSLVLAVLFLDERIRWRRTLGVILAFGGVAVLGFDPNMLSERGPLLLMTASALAAGIGAILLRRLQGISPLNTYAWVALLSTPVLLLLSAVFEPGAIAGMGDVPLRAYGYVLFSAAVSSVIGHAGLAWLLQRYPVTIVSPFTLLSPIIGVLFAVWVLDSPLTKLMIVGGIIALAGVAIITFRGAQKKTVPDAVKPEGLA